MLVAVEGDELVGFTACGSSRDADAGRDTGEVRTLFVAAGRWGGGVGRKLMAAAFEDLSEGGYRKVTVWSFAANERANRFYEAQGFVRDGSVRTEDAWAHIPEHRYVRLL
jgi:GNAT superfamily N-acetyltransferase